MIKVETGLGIRGANSYVDRDYVTSYLRDRAKSEIASWDILSDDQQDGAILAATDYIETTYSSRFSGFPRYQFSEIKAVSKLSLTQIPDPGDSFTVGDDSFRFALALSSPGDVLIGPTVQDCLDALRAAVGGLVGAGVVYAVGTLKARQAVPSDRSDVLELAASAHGASGNFTHVSTTLKNAVLTPFSNGEDGGEQKLSFPRVDHYDRYGNLFHGIIPTNILKASCEYALQAALGALYPKLDFSRMESGLDREKVKIGPIEEEFEYSDLSKALTKRSHPQADALIRPLLSDLQGRVIR